MALHTRRFSFAVVTSIAVAVALGSAQGRGSLTPAESARRWELERELQALAVIDRKVMIPMRDGVRLATDIYRPKNAAAHVPTVFVRTASGIEARQVTLQPMGPDYLAIAGLDSGEEVAVRGAAVLKGIKAGFGQLE